MATCQANRCVIIILPRVLVAFGGKGPMLRSAANSAHLSSRLSGIGSSAAMTSAAARVVFGGNCKSQTKRQDLVIP